jgi:ornithine cyclodeaminase/alanine dehydrogenase-like protein (mu-crystallin family)
MNDTNRREFMLAAGAAAVLAQRVQAADTIKLAIIGTGHRALQHIEALKLIGDYEIVALADPSPEFRDRARKHRNKGVGDARNLESRRL